MKDSCEHDMTCLMILDEYAYFHNVLLTERSVSFLFAFSLFCVLLVYNESSLYVCLQLFFLHMKMLYFIWQCVCTYNCIHS